MESSKKKETMVPEHHKTRIVIKLPVKNDTKTDLDHALVQNQTLVASDGGDLPNQDIQPWKLRSSSTSRQDQDHASAPVHDQEQPSHGLGLGLRFTREKLETRKQSLSIALSEEEIAADVLAITGSKLTRRPKKRSRNVQRQLDNLFPGLFLKSIKTRCYKV